MAARPIQTTRRRAGLSGPLLLMLLAAVLLVGSVNRAQAQPDADQVVGLSVLPELADPDYHVRQQATRKLLQRTGLTLPQVVTLHRHAEHPEQQSRLRKVAMHLLVRDYVRARFDMSESAGALGVRQAGVPASWGLARANVQTDQPVSAVRVVEVLPGFPAFEKLEAGDLITKVDGQSMQSQQPHELAQELGQRIKSVPAGSIITLSLLRDGQPMVVRVQLAPAAALGALWQGGRQFNPELDAQWQRLSQLLDRHHPLPRRVKAQSE